LRRSVLIAALLLLGRPALAAHPLTVDDAGTVAPSTFELELGSARTESALGTTHGLSASARLGILPTTDAGLAVAWFETGLDGAGYEVVLDLKFAPGRADGWRPRLFLRSDFAAAAVSDQVEGSLAALSGGLTWELARIMISVESSWARPLETGSGTASAWSSGAGALLSIHRRAALAAEYRRGNWGDHRADVTRLGLLTHFGAGTASFGAELPVRNVRLDALALVAGWTAEFGL
jgi:hypothetical protein